MCTVFGVEADSRVQNQVPCAYLHHPDEYAVQSTMVKMNNTALNTPNPNLTSSTMTDSLVNMIIPTGMYSRTEPIVCGIGWGAVAQAHNTTRYSSVTIARPTNNTPSIKGLIAFRLVSQ